MVSSGHSEDPAKHPHLRGSNLSLVGHLHCPAFAPICQSRSDNGLVYLCFEPEGNLPAIGGPTILRPIFSNLTMQPARFSKHVIEFIAIELLLVSMVVSAIAVFILVDNNLSSSLHC